jgi:hypothetical protein
MRGAIALLTAVLGVVLVLAGAASLWGGALRSQTGEGSRRPDESTGRSGEPSALERTIAVAGRLPGGERLIGWGVLLLALAAVASGAITFSATATAGTD